MRSCGLEFFAWISRRQLNRNKIRNKLLVWPWYYCNLWRMHKVWKICIHFNSYQESFSTYTTDLSCHTLDIWTCTQLSPFMMINHQMLYESFIQSFLYSQYKIWPMKKFFWYTFWFTLLYYILIFQKFKCYRFLRTNSSV